MLYNSWSLPGVIRREQDGAVGSSGCLFIIPRRLMHIFAITCVSICDSGSLYISLWIGTSALYCRERHLPVLGCPTYHQLFEFRSKCVPTAYLVLAWKSDIEMAEWIFSYALRLFWTHRLHRQMVNFKTRIKYKPHNTYYPTILLCFHSETWSLPCIHCCIIPNIWLHYISQHVQIQSLSQGEHSPIKCCFYVVLLTGFSELKPTVLVHNFIFCIECFNMHQNYSHFTTCNI